VFGGGALEREAGPDDAGKGGYLLIGHRGRFSADVGGQDAADVT
jgi:hypothetical protein